MATGAFTTRSAIWLAIGCFIAIVTSGWAKTYDRCELAHDLQHKYKFPADQISQWICLVRWESEFNTSAIGSLNADGSLDHGLFQISDLYWCDADEFQAACGVTCEALRDDDIKDDVLCVKRIFRQHQKLTGNGFNAWVAWRQRCQADTDSYTADCPSEPDQKTNNNKSSSSTTTTGSKPPAEALQHHSKWLWFSQLFPVPLPFSWF